MKIETNSKEIEAAFKLWQTDTSKGNAMPIDEFNKLSIEEKARLNCVSFIGYLAKANE